MKTLIVTGCYGSGKTEFCVNFALDMRKSTDDAIYIADMDIINPYFRSREKDEFLKGHNIEIVGNALNNNKSQDIPAVSYSFLALISRGERVIMDLAGSENGLKVLAQCYDRITDYELLCVMNRFRPDMDSPAKMRGFVESVNSVSKLPVTGLVNNGHMLRETQAEHVLASQEAVLTASRELNVPFKYTQVKRDIYEQIKDEIASESVIVFDELKMRERWQ